MQSSFRGALRALACVFVLLAQSLPSLAQDETGAANVDAVTWANMRQVLAGTSRKTPDELKKPLDILTPQGLYVIVNASALTAIAESAEPKDPDHALIQYFNYLLRQPGVAGLLLMAPWKTLNPNDPAVNPATVAYQWNALDDALTAVATAHKTLQLVVNPGFNSPPWLFGTPYLGSCDFLFITPFAPPSNSSECGYTDIFMETESGTPTPLPLPMPWNPTYKAEWSRFLAKLHEHIKAENGENYVVSIAVAGPTASSAEMILPNGRGMNNPGTLTLPASVVTPGSKNSTTALAAWNCLTANHYGAMPTSGASYLNADRAFIEEWAAAIDMFGEIFRGLTLVVITGNGLPDFSNETAAPVLGCGLGVSTPAPDKPLPPPVFSSDCDVSPRTLFPMDCASETAILAYFAEPSVGGANAKATEEDALAASDDVVNTLLTFSNASVKWLSELTRGGLTPVPGNSLALGSMPVMSRMLGGLQFAKSPSLSKNILFEGCPYHACEGCLAGPVCVAKPGSCSKKCSPAGFYCAPPPGSTASCPLISPVGAPAEQALLNVLQVYFAGTPGAATFEAPSTLMNNTAPVSNAPMSYLQVWDTDTQYAAGDGGCTQRELMTIPTSCSAHTPPASMPTVPLGVRNYNARELLNLAGESILSTPIALPLFGYNNGSNQLCGCISPYTQRKAFDGDNVCVLPSDKKQAAIENSEYVANYSRDETINVPYGPCKAGYVWRQAYIGDYECVTMSHAKQVANDNIAGASRIKCPP